MSFLKSRDFDTFPCPVCEGTSRVPHTQVCLSQSRGTTSVKAGCVGAQGCCQRMAWGPASGFVLLALTSRCMGCDRLQQLIPLLSLSQAHILTPSSGGSVSPPEGQGGKGLDGRNGWAVSCGLATGFQESGDVQPC